MVQSERRKVVRRVPDLHGMRFHARKIDHDLIEEKIPLGNATESPALVQTKRPRLQFFQMLCAFCTELSRFNKFFQVRLHANRTNYDEEFCWRENPLIIERL